MNRRECPPGPLPWSGSRQRSRDIAYAEAMWDIRKLIADIGRAGVLDAREALAAVHSYANAVGWLGQDPTFSRDWMAHLGDWPGRWDGAR